MRWEKFDWLIEAALGEDGAGRDVTTDALIDPAVEGRADVLVKAKGVICGLPLIPRVVGVAGSGLSVEALREDGAQVGPGDVVAVLAGSAADVLRVERTILNFIQHLSGVASITRRFCDAVAGTAAQIIDTRKTTPGWRALEKYAVRCGGGRNHRMSLSDQMLIKDNHLRLRAGAGGSNAGAIEQAVRAAREAAGGLMVEVEVSGLEGLAEALRAGADIVMLDNMPPEKVCEAAELVRRERPAGGGARLEASGNIGLENVRAYAGAGADCISIGALTHSAPALDIAMDMR
jgi:nicotinate-nucleotide pyrophosphorylase (carboxylating)